MSNHESELQMDEAQALDAVLSIPELATDEWDALRARINRAAELPLARRRALPAHPHTRMRWLPFIAPLAAAAALLLVLRTSVNGPDAVATPELAATEQLLLQNVSDAEFTELVSGAKEAKALLLVAAGAE